MHLKLNHLNRVDAFKSKRHQQQQNIEKQDQEFTEYGLVCTSDAEMRKILISTITVGAE